MTLLTALDQDVEIVIKRSLDHGELRASASSQPEHMPSRQRMLDARELPWRLRVAFGVSAYKMA